MNVNLLFFIHYESIFRELMSHKVKSYAPLRHIALNPETEKSNGLLSISSHAAGVEL